MTIDAGLAHVLSDEPLPVRAYVALGANMGDRARNIRDALAYLAAEGQIRVKKVSSFLENPAVGGPAGSPAFLNAVAEIETTLEPPALLQRLLNIERQLGRVRDRKWEPRTIDLDLLLYGDRVIDTANLKVPHPRMHEREFVLGPLAQIAPDIVHPRLKRSIEALLLALRKASGHQPE